MALTTVNVTGTFNFPDATWTAFTQAEFMISGYDTDTEVVVPRVIKSTLGAAGELDVDLWGNDDGIRGTIYSVNIVLYSHAGLTREVKRIDLGNIQITGDGPFDIAGLLDSPVTVPSVWYMTITQAEYDAAIAAVADAEEAAEAAEDAATAAELAEDGAVAAAASIEPIPAGGDAGQVLGKLSGTDYDVDWIDQTGGGGGSFAYAASRAAIKALDTGDVSDVTLTEFDDSGLFSRDESDLSSTLEAESVASTAVDSGTDTITSVAHGLKLGHAGYVDSTINGITANTLYWVIYVNADNFQLATSYVNAAAGTELDLTGTTNFTFIRHRDPTEGLNIISTGDDLGGANGAWVRRYKGPVHVDDFNAFGDGSTDDTAPILNAIDYLSLFGVGAFPELQFGSKIYRVTQNFAIEQNGFRIRGTGQGRAIASTTSVRGGTSILYDGDTLSSTTGLFHLGNSGTNEARNISIRGLSLLLQDKGNGIYTPSGFNLGDLRDLYIDSPTTGIYLADTSYSTDITDVEVYDPSVGAIDLRLNCHKVVVDRVKLNSKSDTINSPDFGIRVGMDGNCSDVSIINSSSDLYNVDRHFHLAATDCRGMWVAGNYIEAKGDGVTANCIFVGGGSGIITGNRISKSDTPIVTPISYGIQCISTSHDWNITGNYFSGFDTAAVRQANGAININVYGNECAGGLTPLQNQNGVGSKNSTSFNGGDMTTDRIDAEKLCLDYGSNLTIASGSITVTGSRHRVDTEAAASTDDLTTIAGASDGQLLILSTVSSSRDVVVKDGVGNINCAGDFTLATTADRIMLEFDGSLSAWVEVSRKTN